MRRRWFDWLGLGGTSVRKSGVVQFLNFSYNISIYLSIRKLHQTENQKCTTPLNILILPAHLVT